jgi:uncharacterized protein YxjI
VSRRDEPPLDRDTVDGIIRKLMEIDQKLNRILEELNIDDEEEEDA